VVRYEGAAFGLFPMLPGRPKPQEQPSDTRLRGRLLAAVHHDLHDLTVLGQRPDWQRADQVVRNSAAGRERWRGGVSGLPPELVTTVVGELERVDRRLRDVSASGFAVGAVHGDFISQNLLFSDGVLSGVLDLDSTHLDLRAADVACARRSAADDVVRGYLEVAALTDAELAVLDDLWRASVLRYAVYVLDRSQRMPDAATELAWCVRQLTKTRPFCD
jgi:Ser/Thr protein kinase RdoA (MazF antagonist)